MTGIENLADGAYDVLVGKNLANKEDLYSVIDWIVKALGLAYSVGYDDGRSDAAEGREQERKIADELRSSVERHIDILDELLRNKQIDPKSHAFATLDLIGKLIGKEGN